MRCRYRMQNPVDGVGVEAEQSERGLASLRRLRRVDVRFRRRRIYGMIQAYPSRIPILADGRSDVFELTYGENR